VAEEVGLLGARRLDVSRLKSKTGYVLDSSGTVGAIVNRAPTQKTFVIQIRGKSSHAGMEPEKGINAIKVGAAALSRIKEGRLSPITTSNFGLIEGGKATNIVCDYLKIVGEARSHDEGELAGYLSEVEAAFQKAAQEFGAKAEIEVELEYLAFYVKENDPAIKRAAEALKSQGHAPTIVTGGGGMDGNVFNEKGLRAVGLSTGYSHVHTELEEQSISQLISCGRVVAEIIKSTVK
jgi:tripeptide aminopeptidase